MDGWLDGWMDGWMNVWMDGCMHAYTYACQMCAFMHVHTYACVRSCMYAGIHVDTIYVHKLKVA